ncbi:hypothetical protein U0C82_17305 [Fulvimarina sp. 2208YS6-2-32]|uniref:Integrase catalytic domain-containing protein n=1 Tax=Fulvimarina uroteuthidis TaxID=3098149 RepID=A0ABU5I695_9HYPH|nr:hypothetical protein [Fulvimarina sp. 2208YS6-2-32]MDY8110899.1 hypothetical protein [Fulvimarina sp. 2208YS6-2-32]
MLVLHERKTRMTIVTRLTGKTAAETISAMTAIFRRVDPGLRSSVTFDNDTTFARHALLKNLFGMTTWFCDAYASWQKWRRRKREWSIATMAATLARSRHPVRTRSSECHRLAQHHAEEMSWLHHTASGSPQRAWQRRPDPLLMKRLHFTLESTGFKKLTKPENLRQVGAFAAQFRVEINILYRAR